jgi:hypothetical protein
VAATNYIQQTYDRIWDLLEAHAPFISLIRAGNRIDWTTGAINSQAFRTRGDPASLQRAKVELIPPEDGTDDAFTATPHYGHDADFAPATEAWIDNPVETYALRLTYPDRRLDLNSVVENEAKTALRKGGPKLGLSWVFRWGPLSTRRNWGFLPESGGGADTMQSVILIPVQRFHQGRDLVT